MRIGRKLTVGLAAAGLMVGAAALAQEERVQEEQFIGVVKNVDTKNKTITIQLPLSPEATIVRDGAKVSLNSVKPGDDVRASFAPSEEGITRLEVESMERMEQRMKKK
ncbi:MAG: hypothetical protein HYZ28_03030 [Myxococcales bacterium]|nr:hypothetical protein [Myxococcales bacterium]